VLVADDLGARAPVPPPGIDPVRTPRAVDPMSTANCYGCGRFARATTRYQYNGWWNCLYITTHCARCGDIEVCET